jgi:hypothetical protein
MATVIATLRYKKREEHRLHKGELRAKLREGSELYEQFMAGESALQ